LITQTTSSTSTVNAVNLPSKSSKNLFVANWDAQLGDFKCSDFSFKAPVATAGSESNMFTRTALSTSSVAGKMRTIAVGTYRIFDINSPAVNISALQGTFPV